MEQLTRRKKNDSCNTLPSLRPMMAYEEDTNSNLQKAVFHDFLGEEDSKLFISDNSSGNSCKMCSNSTSKLCNLKPGNKIVCKPVSNHCGQDVLHDRNVHNSNSGGSWENISSQ